MKYAIIIPDGCADEPQESLGGKTPLEAARMPAMDAIAAGGRGGPGQPRARRPAGRLGRGQPQPAWATTRCEHFTGRAPLEAAAQGIQLGPEDWAVRCNLVTVEDQVMRDFTAGHISTDEATALLATVQEKLGSERFAVLSRRQLSQFAALSRSGPALALFPRYANHAAPRSDRQVGARRLSPRAGQRPAQPIDERQRGGVRRSSGERRAASAGQAAGHERLALGPGAARRG